MWKRRLSVVGACVLWAAFGMSGGNAWAEKPRVVVVTDMSNEPDDEESMVRFLVYSNEFEVEGLIAGTSTWLKTKPREDLIRRQIAAFGEVRANLVKHAPGYPTAEALLAVTSTGQPTYGMTAVGEGKSTAGSKRIIEVLEKGDERPVWVTLWGGANTLAQALLELRAAKPEAEVRRLAGKIWAYGISDQDDAGAWVRKEFPEVQYVVSPSNPDGKEYARATWTGISGDRFYKNGPMHKFEMVDNPWLAEHVRNKGALGALYPKLSYIMEGDTPSFLGLIENGLGWTPAYGGWGGRYVLYRAYGETRPIWTNNADSRDTVTADNGKTETTDPATIWRWREQYQNDFAGRMAWCVADAYEKANHNPVAVLNGDKTKAVVKVAAKSEGVVKLSAEGTGDPDKNKVAVKWWIYGEAGTAKVVAKLSAAEGMATEVTLPKVTRASQVHVIMEVADDGVPVMTAYRRAVVEVAP